MNKNNTKLNIPIKLLKEYKDDKQGREVLAFAIAIKCMRSNSVLTDVSNKKVMNEFKISHERAVRLINLAKQHSELFIYNESRNSLSVKSFKSSEAKYSIKNHKYTSDYVYKLTIREFTINDLTCKIQEILLMNAIRAFNLKDNLKLAGAKASCCAEGLTQGQLSKIAGTNRIGVNRLLNSMADKGLISKTKCEMDLVISCLNEETVKEWNEKTNGQRFFVNRKNNTGWTFSTCKYSYIQKTSYKEFRHVIYNHERRLKVYNYPKNPKDIMDSERMSMFS